MSSHLPEEVVVKEILSRLPPKSLIRFKCVSKSWHALIGKPDFLSKNLLNHSIITQNSNDPLRLMMFFSFNPGIAVDLRHSFRNYDSLLCAPQTPLTLPPAPSFRLVASCNGLLCIWSFEVSIVYLCNPAMSSELKALPAVPSQSHCRGEPRPARYDLFFHQVGFGFDSVSNDFKVVTLVDEDEDGLLVAKMYSLRCRSWRRLDLGVPSTLGRNFLETAALDGVFLWYDYPIKEHSNGMVAFDFSNEEFRTMPYPDCGEGWGTVVELKGSLAVLVIPQNKMHLRILDIWVMLEFGVSESWTRLLRIELPSHLQLPLGFWKNGELFVENSRGQLVLYDLLSQTETELQFKNYHGMMNIVELRLSSVVINELGGRDNP